MKALLLLTMLTGCVGCVGNGTFEPKFNQADVENAVWRKMFSEDSPAPPLEWREPQCGATDTTEVWGVWSFNIASNGKTCVFGFYWPGGGIVVADRTGTPNWLTVAHEWFHAHAWLTLHGDTDLRHERLDWFGLDNRVARVLTDAGVTTDLTVVDATH